MIVKCANCQTRFKIGDDKVTEKGVKVRCTKCSTVFTVRKEGGEVPAPETAKSPSSAAPSKASSLASTPLSDLLGADLVAKPVASFGAPPPPPAGALDDPFAAFMSTPAPPASNGAGLMPGEFALSGSPPPAPAAPVPHGGTSAEDLLGLGTSWPAPAAPALASPTAPDPFDAALDPLGGSAAPASAADPFGTLPADPFGDLPASVPPPAPTVASFGAEFDAGSFDPLAGLSLDPAAIPGDSGEGVEADGAASSELFDLPPKPAPQAPAATPGSAPPLAPSHPPSSGAVPMGRIVPVQSMRQVEERRESSSAEDKPLANRLFSALTGAAMVVLLVLGFVAYRNGGRLDLRDPLSAVFSAFGFSRPVPPSLSLPTQITSSGFYPTLRGDPVLFVRGTVKNLTPAPVQVDLKLDVLVDGRTVATAEGEPGQLPTPEDLFALKGAPDVKALHERLATLAPTPVAAGHSAEFVLVTAELPEGLRSGIDRAELIVAARPHAGPGSAPPSPVPAVPAGGKAGAALAPAAPAAAPMPPKTAAAAPPTTPPPAR